MAEKRSSYDWAEATSHDALVEMLEVNQAKAILAESTGLGLEDFSRPIGRALRANTACIAFECTGNLMRSNYVYPIARALTAYNSTLIHLNLSSNKIGETGAGIIGTMLSENATLEVLYLEKNRITDEGGVSIAKGLMNNDALVYLSLHGNKISDDSATAFGALLTQKKRNTLVDLKLSRNFIRESGLRDIVDNLKSNYLVRTIDLSRNPIHDAFQIIHLRGILHRNAKMHNEDLQKLMSAVNMNSKGVWNHSKLMVLGRGRMGKSATVRSLLNQKFNEKWISTIGATLSQASMDVKDTAGGDQSLRQIKSEVDYTIRLAANKFADEDIKEETKPGKGRWSIFNRRSSKKRGDTREHSVKSVYVPRLKSFASSHGEDEVGTRKGSTDRRESVGRDENTEAVMEGVLVDKIQMDEIVKRRQNVQHLTHETVQKNGTIHFTIWDYGGQEVFYSLHHLFLTQYGVYLIVFNLQYMNRDDNGTAFEDLRFWLNSVNVHARFAPVLLVGTFLDALAKNKDSVDKQVRSINEKVRKAIDFEKFPQVAFNGELSFYAVSNKLNIGFKQLRKQLRNAALSQAHLQDLVPLSWMRCLDQLVLDGESSYLSLDKVLEIAKGVGISEEELQHMLRLVNELGIVVYLPHSEILKEKVICNPQWLLDQFGKLIRDKDVHKNDKEHLDSIGLGVDLERLQNEALVSRDLLEVLWDKAEVDFLLELMNESLLMAPWRFIEDPCYLIPCLLEKDDFERTEDAFVPVESTQLTSLKEIQLHMNCNESLDESTTCIMDFTSSFLPIGVYQRFVCLCIANSGQILGSPAPFLSHSRCAIWFGKDSMVGIKKHGDFVLIQCNRNHAQTVPVLLALLRKVSEIIGNIPIKWRILFTKDGTEVTYDKAKAMKLSPWFNASKTNATVKPLALDAIL